ncbi:LysM peptidoglycan-binding domain-containing protein [Salinicola sp. CPA57]|uniref:LysM peptidoglycan-binding domain-containing protein n=1 Tax=Salinicola sp. CPA57 TaxID=1949080 RepID=UPI0013008A5D|nr:LysM peptidoglycan-binding domain-containing protein [Salinicola sp. CPA57]
MISLEGWRARRPRCRGVAARLLMSGGLALLAALPTSAWALSAQADSPSARSTSLSLRADAPASYTVRQGDTLWGIAARFLEAPWRWQKLWQRNPQIGSPRSLYPGDVISLTTRAGTPGLSLERGRGQPVRLSPGVRRVPARQAVPGLPLARIKVFLEAYQIVDPGVIEGAPTVLAGQGQRLLSGAGDRLYAHGSLPAVGATLGVYRPGNDYRSPAASDDLANRSITGSTPTPTPRSTTTSKATSTNTPAQRSLGLELRRLGHVRVSRNVGDVGELEVLDAVQEIRNGDYLLALDEGGIATRFLPRAPETPVVATILSVPNGVRFIGRHDVVAIDRGRADGLETGHVLQVMRQGERVHDDSRDDWVTLPDTEAGAVMVFRVFDHLSYALVMRASQVLAVGDRLVVPRDLRETLASGGAF